MKKKSLKVVHVPYSKRNPYQRLLGDNLKELGLKIIGEQIRYLYHISFFNITFLSILFRHWKPDIIHLHWQHPFLLEKSSRFKTVIKSIVSLLQIVFLKLLRVKLVWTVHNLKSHENTHRDLELSFTRVLARLSDVIIVHSKNAKREISKEFNIKKNHKINIIPHGNFIDCYPNLISQEEARNRLNLSNSKLIFLLLGEVRYYKGVLELIDAFQSLSDENIELIIAGKPHDTTIVDEIKTRINGNKNVHTIFNFIPDDELQIYINASDIMLYPYRDIFTSGGILLAMSFGKPIIAPRLGSISNILDSSGAFLYNPEDKNGLSRALKKAIVIKDKTPIMGEYNFELAKRFAWHEIALQTYQAYIASF